MRKIRTITTIRLEFVNTIVDNRLTGNKLDHIALYGPAYITLELNWA